MRTVWFLLFFCFSWAAHADMTASAFVATYEKANPEDRDWLETILATQEEGMAWSNAVLQKGIGGTPLYCSPPAIVLAGGQLIDILTRAVEDSPAYADMPFGIVLLYSLMDAFPCEGEE